MLYYLTEQNGLLYAGGVGGSGGFAWADPATGESGGAGIFRALRLNAVAAEGETLYLAGQDLDAEKPGYGLYTAGLGRAATIWTTCSTSNPARRCSTAKGRARSRP